MYIYRIPRIIFFIHGFLDQFRVDLFNECRSIVNEVFTYRKCTNSSCIVQINNESTCSSFTLENFSLKFKGYKRKILNENIDRLRKLAKKSNEAGKCGVYPAVPCIHA